MGYKTGKGFSLIELMVTVAIVAILAAVAVPAYNAQVQKARRADGISMMMQIAQQQERYFSKNFSYASSVTDLGYAASPASSEEGYYNVSTSSAGCVSGAVNTCFVVSAVAVGAQLDDTSCRTFMVTEMGSTTSENSSGTDTTQTCY